MAPPTMWLRGVGIGARERHVFEAGSYSSTVPTEVWGRAGCTADCPGPATAPPITYIFSPALTATGEPRRVGSGASARQLSLAGSYSHALSIGTHAGAPDCGRTKPPNA